MNKRSKIALAACSGMSPYGLISRVTSSDIVPKPIIPYHYVWVLLQLIEMEFKI